MVSDATLCHGCGKSAAGQLVCHGCGVVQTVVQEPDYFSIFGLSRSLAIDLGDLEGRYYGLARQLHPDLLHDRSPAEQAAGLRATALLTRAYRTLKDPVQRGLYWLSLHDESLGRNNERVPPELAETVFEVQEKLEALRQACGAGDAHALRRAVEETRAELGERLEGMRRRLSDNFAVTDRSGEEGAHLAETKAILSELHYLKTLVRDVDKELEPRWNES